MAHKSLTAAYLCALCVLCGENASAQEATQKQPPPQLAATWPKERVELRDGRRWEGLIESEDETWVHLIQVQQPAGRPMYLVIRPFARASIARIERLDAARREEVREKIDQYRNRLQIESGLLDAVGLTTIDEGGRRGYRYQGKWFSLESTAEERITRQLVVHAEQIFTAYRQILPPRCRPERPLGIFVLGTMSQYEAELARRRLELSGHACFLSQENLVLAGSDISRHAAQVAAIAAQHKQIRKELDDMERRLAALQKQWAEMLRQQNANRRQMLEIQRRKQREAEQMIGKKRQELDRADRENARLFSEAAGQTLRRLAHEAFHAYLENYAYPRQRADVPPWLNEGLAVMFEGGVLESGALRIDAPNREALQRLKADVDGPRPLPLSELLAADGGAFLRPENDRYYAYAWGVAYYLTFENRLLGGDSLDQYVQPTAKTASPRGRFEQLVGRPLAEFENHWRQYVRKLR